MLKEVKRALNIKDGQPAKMPTESTDVGETVVVEVADEDQIAEAAGIDSRTDMDEFCSSLRESSTFDNDLILGANDQIPSTLSPPQP